MQYLKMFESETRQILPGEWKQTSSTAGDNPNIRLSIRNITKDIIELNSNNGWVGFAYYDQKLDEYKGFFEWKEGFDDSFSSTVFIIRLIYEEYTLNMDVKSDWLNFSATFRKILIKP